MWSLFLTTHSVFTHSENPECNLCIRRLRNITSTLPMYVLVAIRYLLKENQYWLFGKKINSVCPLEERERAFSNTKELFINFSCDCWVILVLSLLLTSLIWGRQCCWHWNWQCSVMTPRSGRPVEAYYQSTCENTFGEKFGKPIFKN